MNIPKEILAGEDIAKLVKYLLDNGIKSKDLATVMDYNCGKGKKANAVYMIRDGKAKPAWDKAYSLIQYLYTIDPDFSADDIFKNKTEIKEMSAKKTTVEDKTKLSPTEVTEVPLTDSIPQGLSIDDNEIVLVEQIGGEEQYREREEEIKKWQEDVRFNEFLIEHKIEIDNFINQEFKKYLYRYNANISDPEKAKTYFSAKTEAEKQAEIEREKNWMRFYLKYRMLSALREKINGAKSIKGKIEQRFCEIFAPLYLQEESQDEYMSDSEIQDCINLNRERIESLAYKHYKKKLLTFKPESTEYHDFMKSIESKLFEAFKKPISKRNALEKEFINSYKMVKARSLLIDD